MAGQQPKRGIAILGGTFDPIHNGHLTIAVWLRDNLNYHTVHLIPCYQPPHGKTPLASAQQRLTMVKLAIVNIAGLSIDECEIQRQGKSYMADTLQQLHHRYPNEPLLLAIGSDAFLTLPQWHHWQQITALAQLVIIPRPGDSLAAITAMGQQLQLTYCDNTNTDNQNFGTFLIADMTPIEPSSTHIRQLLKQGKTPTDLPPAVAEFIQQQQLYSLSHRK
ncbi:MAG: nicotinate-nucleotide adenylyltransferase [Gammaproteobacteria bacterium]|nr:nicotinate-nucleotide adenylyltransferase [Gammaproteobacteria bacterium]